MKISIRVSILSILLTLLLIVSFFIVAINYYNLNKFFKTAAQSYLTQACHRASEQIARYLNPLGKRLILATRLINNNDFIPSDSSKFINFLQNIIIDEAGVNGAKWGDDTNGNYFKVGKNPDGGFYSYSIVHTSQGDKKISATFNPQMELIETHKNNIDYDPRIRPWYQISKFTKTLSWLIFPMLNLETNTATMAIAASAPIYNKDKTLRGVFSIDMPLTTITDYVKNIYITKNSAILIIDEKGRLITAFADKIDLSTGYRMPKIQDIHIPWIEEAFNIHMQQRKPVFEFTYKNKDYVAAFDEITAAKSQYKWFVGVVTPMSDIIAPLQKNAFISLLIILGAILIGIIASTIFSAHISKPINKLASDADSICQLRLTQVQTAFSYIKEVAQMVEAFTKMKNALHSFQRYLPVTLVKNLVSSGKIAEVGGETKEITITFTDIRNFTPLSETMPPKELTHYLSEYFQVIAKTVLKNFGTVDKYLGDGTMSFWGAPLDDPEHALHACQTAIQLKTALRDLNTKWHKEHKPQVETCIGINTGTAVVGNIGSDDRLSYTTIGDAVNLASRLEKINRTYGTSIIISEFTYHAVKEYFQCRLLDKVIVKGKKQEIYIYELIAEKTPYYNHKLEQYNSQFNEAFTYYQKGEWDQAITLFNNLENQHPTDKLLKMFIQRCLTFKQQPPSNWAGTWVITEK